MAVSVYWHGKGEGTGRRWGEEENRGERRGAEGREGVGKWGGKGREGREGKGRGGKEGEKEKKEHPLSSTEISHIKENTHY